MKLEKSKTTLTPKQITRLYRMGLTDISGLPKSHGVELLASVISGCLYCDMDTHYGIGAHTVSFYVSLLPVVIGEGEPIEYLKLIELEYTAISEPIPKSLRLLAEDSECLRCFLIAFLENWSQYLREDRLLGGEGR